MNEKLDRAEAATDGALTRLIASRYTVFVVGVVLGFAGLGVLRLFM